MAKIRVSIRGIDAGVFQDAKVAALKTKVNLGDWFTEAAKAKLKKERGEK